jgi:hypothetical protein
LATTAFRSQELYRQLQERSVRPISSKHGVSATQSSQDC